MESLYFGSAKGGLNHGGAGTGPWIMADMENALWGADRIVSNEDPITFPFVTAMIKGDRTKNHSGPPFVPPTKPGPATVKINSDVCPGSNDLANFPCTLANQSRCNLACYRNRLCMAYVLHSGTCFLKSCSSPIVPAAGSTLWLISASNARGPPPGHVRRTARAFPCIWLVLQS
eukprot:SAG31_NODE_377_length_16533_cov_99.867957_14_plen_174_part_00